jgi:hypothetical protein
VPVSIGRVKGTQIWVAFAALPVLALQFTSCSHSHSVPSEGAWVETHETGVTDSPDPQSIKKIKGAARHCWSLHIRLLRLVCL